MKFYEFYKFLKQGGVQKILVFPGSEPIFGWKLNDWKFISIDMNDDRIKELFDREVLAILEPLNGTICISL